MLENKEFRQSYFRESQTRNDFKDVTISVWCYKGPLSEPPMWRDVNTGSYTPFISFPTSRNWRLSRADKYVKIWTIKLDLSHVNSSPLSRSDEEQGNYYRIDYDVVFLFGRTNLKVQLAWKENVSSILLPLLLAKTHMIVLPVK